jgi:hypothetical protein
LEGKQCLARTGRNEAAALLALQASSGTPPVDFNVYTLRGDETAKLSKIGVASVELPGTSLTDPLAQFQENAER